MQNHHDLIQKESFVKFVVIFVESGGYKFYKGAYVFWAENMVMVFVKLIEVSC